MGYTFQEKVDMIEGKITQPDFLKNKGLGNEVGYYIFDYLPKHELDVRAKIAKLKDKFNKGNSAFEIVEFDLYEIILSILKERGYLQKCFDFEQDKGVDYMFDAIIKMLRLTGDNNLIIRNIVDNVPENCVVFITGVGKSYPIVRSHNVLNNLHQVLDSVPVIMFYPGEYTGQGLKLFGTLKDDNYYRAFQLI